jgi:Rho GTPase-activating protein 1
MNVADALGLDFEGHQLICICACHFPSPRQIAYDALLPLLLESIDSFVTNEYTLVFFAGNAQHKPNMHWTLSAYQSLGRKYRKGIKKLFIVHSGTWTRIVLEVTGRVVSPKFAKKIKYVATLSELAEYIPLTQVSAPRTPLWYIFMRSVSVINCVVWIRLMGRLIFRRRYMRVM